MLGMQDRLPVSWVQICRLGPVAARDKARHSNAPCSHAHISLERKHSFKHKFKLLKQAKISRQQVCLLLPYAIHRSLCLSPCPSLPPTLQQPLLSHQMRFRTISTWSENALGKCRKHTVKLGSSISSAECDSFLGMRITAQQSIF